MNRLLLFLAFVFVALSPQGLLALPFNDDMVDTPVLRPGISYREPVAGTVPRGSLSRRAPSTVEAAELTNPKSTRDKFSVSHGKRLFEVNCSPCHGVYDSAGKNIPSEIATTKMLKAAPDLNTDYYRERPDGHYFSVVHFGFGLMPAVGWKLSKDETWDIVTYIRSLQN